MLNFVLMGSAFCRGIFTIKLCPDTGQDVTSKINFKQTTALKVF